MNKTVQKSLQHVSNTLKEVNQADAYSELYDALVKLKIKDNVLTDVMVAYNTCTKQQFKKVEEAREWLKAIIDDIE